MFSIFTHVMKPVRDTVSLGHLCLNLERGETAVFAGDKKAWCTCKVIVLQICCFRLIAFSPFSLPSLSSLLKLPNLSKYSTVYLPPFLSQRRENFVLRVSGFFVKDPIKSVRRRPKISEDAGFRSVPNDSVAVLSFQKPLISGESKYHLHRLSFSRIASSLCYFDTFFENGSVKAVVHIFPPAVRHWSAGVRSKFPIRRCETRARNSVPLSYYMPQLR